MHPQGIAGRPLNVLIVEDSVEDAERAVLELRRAGYAPDYRRVATAREMSAALDERPWDLVLCAHSLSDFTYEGALALVREKRIPAPVLLVSATVVDEAAVSAVKAGARDIIMKDRLSRLAHAVERELEAARNRIRQGALEEGLQRSEKRFRALIEHSFDAICLLDAQAVMLYASPSAERILGYAAGELVGRNALDLVAPEDRPLAQQRLGEVLAMPGQTLTVQVRVIRKDGDVIWTEHFGTNLLDEESVAAVVVNFRDITGQKRFEQILRENEERAQRELAELEHIYHTAPVGLCLIGADLRYLRINERLAGLNGLPDGDHLGRTVWEVIPEAARFFAPLLLRIMGSGRPVLNWQFRTETSAAGGPRDLLASYYPVKAASGKIVGVAGVVQEITELKRVERALRESEKRFRALIENSADGFVLLDAHGKLLYSGPPILGYESQELRGRGVLDLIHPDERPGLPGAFAAFLERPGAVVTSEHRVRHKNGSWRWIEAVGKNLLDDRVIGGIVVNYRDVTERKRLDEQLRQTQKLESIGVLAGGVAHDFNNLLTGVLGNATLALDLLGPEHAGRSHVEEVIKAAESAAHLTRQLLAYAGKLQRHTGRDRDDVPLGYRRRGDLNVLGEPAGVIVPEGGEGVAEIVLLSPAVDALSATNHGGDDDVHADRDFGVHTRAGLVHGPDDFVSGNRRRNDILLSVSEDALVRATHRTAAYSKHDLSRSRRGPRYSLHSDVAWPVIDCGFHLRSHLSFFGWRLPAAAAPLFNEMRPVRSFLYPSCFRAMRRLYWYDPSVCKVFLGYLPAAVELSIPSVTLVFAYSRYPVDGSQRQPSSFTHKRSKGFNGHCATIKHAITFRRTTTKKG